MHELSIALELERLCHTEIASRGGGRLESVTVAIGERAAVEPELLTYAWHAIATAARLIIERVQAQQLCACCGEIEESALGSWLKPCPRCGEPLRVSGGDELEVIGLTYTEETIEEEVPA